MKSFLFYVGTWFFLPRFISHKLITYITGIKKKQAFFGKNLFADQLSKNSFAFTHPTCWEHQIYSHAQTTSEENCPSHWGKKIFISEASNWKRCGIEISKKKWKKKTRTKWRMFTRVTPISLCGLPQRPAHCDRKSIILWVSHATTSPHISYQLFPRASSAFSLWLFCLSCSSVSFSLPLFKCSAFTFCFYVLWYFSS